MNRSFYLVFIAIIGISVISGIPVHPPSTSISRNSDDQRTCSICLLTLDDNEEEGLNFIDSRGSSIILKINCPPLNTNEQEEEEGGDGDEYEDYDDPIEEEDTIMIEEVEDDGDNIRVEEMDEEDSSSSSSSLQELMLEFNMTCRHRDFHEQCLATWFQTQLTESEDGSVTCPICRSPAPHNGSDLLHLLNRRNSHQMDLDSILDFFLFMAGRSTAAAAANETAGFFDQFMANFTIVITRGNDSSPQIIILARSNNNATAALDSGDRNSGGDAAAADGESLSSHSYQITFNAMEVESDNDDEDDDDEGIDDDDEGIESVDDVESIEE